MITIVLVELCVYTKGWIAQNIAFTIYLCKSNGISLRNVQNQKLSILI